MPSTPPPAGAARESVRPAPPPQLNPDDVETRRISFAPYVEPVVYRPASDAEDSAPDLATLTETGPASGALEAARAPEKRPLERARLGPYARFALALLGSAVLYVAVRRVYGGGSAREEIARAASSAPAIGANTEPMRARAPSDDVAGPVLDFDAALAEEPEGAKRDALLALEARRLPEAIAAGERAVALDSTDGEAWLILGAAYQEFGQMVEARRCYRACVTMGKRDPRGECAAMLR